MMKQETPHKGLLLRGDASDLQQGEALLTGAIQEGKSAPPESFFIVFVMVWKHCMNTLSIGLKKLKI